ncbi:MAG TPA: aminotransferase class I/II-fold pyridoxal phosphate-dependent enzyme [Candidatus Eisenbergiella merdigallinarum]|uniref:Aminotransferase class I/II-fold pyridoxal phosphate-dependent enzyme n=1 Tax=Candidatus Eisenbergiella merdigallinarum TaxID=2838552 RepID=A0A9D2MQX9_9FIRM|nr:aminotransferase class I/II-fold pyridoxal phosphate-dependent enzyme [Candidatus Eisenbergiella merdigallinarum]
MKLELADRMKEYEEGIFQLLDEKKKELTARGKTVYNLSVGTPDFPPQDFVMEAVCAAAGKPENYKYSLGDLPELIRAVRDRFAVRYGVELEAEEVASVYGSQEGIAHIGFCLLDPGDEVLVPDPGYPIFSVGPALAGAKLSFYELREENGWLPDLDALSEQADRAKFMIVSYPMNPICKCAPRSFYERLIPWAKRHDLLIVHDNAYSDIVYDGREGISILSVPGAKECCVEFYSLSKSFDYTGARMGFLAGNARVVQALKKLRSQIDYGTFLPVQYGAIAALTGPDEPVLRQREEYQKRRDALCRGFSGIGWKIEDSEGTMFAWAKIPDSYGEDDVRFVMELMEKTGVLCTPGSSFGSLGKGHVRFAFVIPVSEIEKAVEAVRESGILKKG